MIITQRGVLPPVQFTELDASLQSSILSPAGTRLIAQADIIRTITEGSNAAAVTLTVGLVDIVSLGLITFALGDLIWFDGQCSAVKGATLGATALQATFTDGTGQVRLMSAQNIMRVVNVNIPAGNTPTLLVGGWARCTQAGNVTPRLQGESFTSDSTVPIGNGRFGILVI